MAKKLGYDKYLERIRREVLGEDEALRAKKARPERPFLVWMTQVAKMISNHPRQHWI
jgi:hypothetical protein